MPSVSKKQQKFMGIVRSIQKGEQPASKFSKDAQDAAKSMKKGSVKKYAKTKHDDLPTKKIKEGAYKSATKNELAQYIINLNNMLAVAKSKKMTNHIKFIQQDIKDVKKALSKKKNESVNEAERDYKDEYKKFQSSTKSKKYRAELNKYNRQKGTYGNGDGKDASHKGGKIVGFEKESKNRGRAEKSRLKKENNMPDFNPIIDEVLDEVFGEYQMNENSKVLKSIENLAKQNKYGNVTGTKMNGKTANLIMKIYNHPKMKKYQKAMEKYTSDELVDMTLKMPKVLGIKENVDEALDPYKDFDGSPKEEYNLNLGAFVEHYQDFIKFMKKHKEVPDKNKREWALAIRNKVGRGMFNGHMSQMSNIMDLLQMGDKFRNLKESVNESISAFDVDFYKDTNNRQTSHKEIVKGDKFSDVISKTTKVAKSKKMNYVELYYKGAFIGSIDKRNNFKFRKGRNHQKSPLSVNEVNMAHVYSKDLNKKKFKDLGLYLSNVLDLAPNKDFRLTTNKKLLAINIDKINPKSLQNIKKRFGIDLKQKAKEPIRLKSKSGMGKISHLGMESVNESISAFDVDFYKDTNNRQTSHKEIVKGDKFSDVISKTTKVAKSKKMNYVELYYKGAFIGSIDKRNNFKFRKGRNHQKSPLSVNEGQKKQASMILRKFDMAYIKFSQEVRDVMKLMDKSTGSRVDGKIINKAYGKHLIPFDDIMQSWARGQQENPGLSEDETLEGLGDKFGKKLDKYNKKNKKSKDALKKYAKLKKK